jgi:hypothetical protein
VQRGGEEVLAPEEEAVVVEKRVGQPGLAAEAVPPVGVVQLQPEGAGRPGADVLEGVEVRGNGSPLVS